MKKVKSNKLGRRILSFVLTVVLMVGLMPGNILTVSAEAVNLPTTLVVDGVSVISSGTVGTTTGGTGWSYDSSTSTLTLSNANITNGDNGYGAGIYYDGGDLTINLFGENTIGYSGHGMSIFFKADTNERTLTITGDGSLMLTGSLYNEYSTGEGKINIVGTTLTTSDISGLGDVTIIDSTVIADGAGWAGIYSEANVIITNSYVEAKSSDGGGIQVSDHLKIIDSQVEIGGSKGDIVNYSSRTYTDSVVTTSTETTVYGEAALKEELTIASGETINFEEGASITNTDKLTVEDDAIVSENGALHTHNTDGAVTYTYVDDSCHEKVTACLNCPIGYVAETSEVHTGGTATCTAKSVCAICKNEYGELDFNNHTSDKYTNGFRNCCGEYQPATLTTDKYDIDGDSIKDNVYEIGNAGQLYWFAELVNGTLDGVEQDNYADAVLTEDIIVNSGTFSVDSNNNPLYNGYEISETNKPLEWVPIGIYYDSDGNGTVDSNEYAFYYGTFDGNNHTVSGLYLNDSSQNFVGLFGRSADTVKNVGVINSYFNGNNYVGGVCGSGFEIINCCNKSIVSGTESVGGVCGFINSTHRSIVNCYNTGVVLGTENIGGVCGYGYCVIVNCYNTGDVTGSSNIGEIYGYGEGAYANNYYLADSDDGNGGKTAEQFASGEAVYLLSQGCTIEADDVDFYEDQIFSGEIWGQTLSGDSMEVYPVLNGKKVYYGYLSCAENAARVYTNDSNASDTKPEHTPNADDGNCTTAITCSVCGTVTTEAKAAHSPKEDDGDCTTAIVCSDCGTVTTAAKASHTPNADDGDCTTAVTCSVCGEVTTAAKAGHTPNADDGDCTTAITCSVCGEVTTEAKAGHTPNADDGDCTTAVTCSVCGKVTTEAKAEHTPEVGTEIASEDGSATYKVTEARENGNSVTYEAPTDKNQATVVVPATVTINNITYNVTTISDTAFAGNKKLTSVTIGDNVTGFSAKTFKGCSNLKTLIIGNGVTSIPANAFKNFKKLTTVKMGTGVKTIGKNAFYGCKKLKNLTIGKNVVTIGDKAFYKCTSLTKLTIPSKVKTIGKSAFYGCKALKTITIGKSVTKIGSKAFYGCSKTKTLTIKSSKLTTKKIGSKAFTKTPKSMTVKVPKKKFKAYKSMFIKRGVNKKAKFRKS